MSSEQPEATKTLNCGTFVVPVANSGGKLHGLYLKLLTREIGNTDVSTIAGRPDLVVASTIEAAMRNNGYDEQSLALDHTTSPSDTDPFPVVPRTGAFFITFDHYEPVPANIATQIAEGKK